MLHNTSDPIIYKTFSVYPGEIKRVILPDETEGDIFFNFIIEHLSDKQTSVQVIDNHQAEIRISVESYRKTVASTPIRLGTYKGIYDLYLDYEVFPEDVMGRHNVVISFITKRTQNGSR